MTTATHRPLIPGVFLNCSSFNAHFPPFVGRLIYPNIYAGSGFLWSFFKHDILGGRRRIVTFTTFIRVRLLKWNWIRLGDKRPFPFICGPIEREERKEGRRSSVSQGRGREREGGTEGIHFSRARKSHKSRPISFPCGVGCIRTTSE